MAICGVKTEQVRIKHLKPMKILRCHSDRFEYVALSLIIGMKMGVIWISIRWTHYTNPVILSVIPCEKLLESNNSTCPQKLSFSHTYMILHF
jgi:hypothetical protein